MTWKRKTVGLGMSLAVLAALAMSSGADAWFSLCIIKPLDAWF